MDNRNDVIEIDLWEVFALLLGHIWFILAGLAVGVLAAFSVSNFLITPTYESTTKMVILSKQNGENITYSDMQLGSQLTKDYAQLITSRYVLEQIITKFGLEMDYEGLLSRVEVVTPADTRILAITVTDEQPMMARELADAIREVAREHITNVMNVEAANVVDYANLPAEPTAPNVRLITVIGGVVGLFLTVFIILVRFFLDDSIKTSEEVMRYLELSTLALIPVMEDDKKKKREKKKRTVDSRSGVLKQQEMEGEDTMGEMELADLGGIQEIIV